MLHTGKHDCPLLLRFYLLRPSWLVVSQLPPYTKTQSKVSRRTFCRRDRKLNDKRPLALLASGTTMTSMTRRCIGPQFFNMSQQTRQLRSRLKYNKDKPSPSAQFAERTKMQVNLRSKRLPRFLEKTKILLQSEFVLWRAILQRYVFLAQVRRISPVRSIFDQANNTERYDVSGLKHRVQHHAASCVNARQRKPHIFVPSPL